MESVRKQLTGRTSASPIKSLPEKTKIWIQSRIVSASVRCIINTSENHSSVKVNDSGTPYVHVELISVRRIVQNRLFLFHYLVMVMITDFGVLPIEE